MLVSIRINVSNNNLWFDSFIISSIDIINTLGGYWCFQCHVWFHCTCVESCHSNSVHYVNLGVRELGQKCVYQQLSLVLAIVFKRSNPFGINTPSVTILTFARAHIKLPLHFIDLSEVSIKNFIYLIFFTATQHTNVCSILAITPKQPYMYIGYNHLVIS